MGGSDDPLAWILKVAQKTPGRHSKITFHIRVETVKIF